MNTKNLKPFNLQAALKGTPVMLRSGRKAFVRHHETEANVANNSRLMGTVVLDNGGAVPIVWSQNGNHGSGGMNRVYDIIGMYPKTRIINGFEVPAPETEEPKLDTHYHMPSLADRRFHSGESWDDSATDKYWLKRGLVFLSAEDAIANAKAMLGIDPHNEEGEE